MSADLKNLKSELLMAIEKAEHKPGQWAETAQSMGGICSPGKPFKVGEAWAKELPWASFSFKRDSWLAVAAVNALPAMLAKIDELMLRACYWKQRAKSAEGHLFASDFEAAAKALHRNVSLSSIPWGELSGCQKGKVYRATLAVIVAVNERRDARAPRNAEEVATLSTDNENVSRHDER
ncbi:hypothetical protein [Pseudomonas sp. TSRC2-2]|uniref:hypothetical protein n=1 Tax=unclassified Pseudomonas TaxID=196821 RepID=UPI003CEF671C